MSGLAFFVTAPKSQIDADVFGELVSTESIRSKVVSRVASYEGERDEWLSDCFEPLLARVRVEVLSWESLLVGAPEALTEFYARCLKYNDRQGGRG